MIDWLQSNIPPWVLIAFVIHGVVLGSVAYLILLERKVASWTQDRIGPNRVGLGFGIIPWLKDKRMFGLGQPMADGLKFFLKEDYRPKGVDRILFTIAPAIMMAVVIVSIAVIPWGGWVQSSRTITVHQSDINGPFIETSIQQAAIAKLPSGSHVVGEPSRVGFISADAMGRGQQGQVTLNYRWPFQIAHLNIGVLFVLATLSLAVYGIVIGGWASNNKYSFLGGLRATASMISYEIPLGLSVLAIVVMFGTLDLSVIVERQVGYIWGFVPAWNVFIQPLAFLIFLICIHAEANRAPFDLAEAEQELVGGYHTEYSSMRFALFFLAEYAGMITTSAVGVALFFGGWHIPGMDRAVAWVVNLFGGDATFPAEPSVTNSIVVCIFRTMAFFAKTVGIIFIFMWVRWSLPRFRFDQLMIIAWRGLIPISLAQLMVTAVVLYYYPANASGMVDIQYYTANAPGVLNNQTALALLIANVALVIAAMIVSLIVPAAPLTNRRVKVPGSRFNPEQPVGHSV